ncbi:TRAP transporter small permease [Nitratireductor sp. ZSWI3]|uniref:TRAP transporter small permease n=1 Tax=Nitratireductor sp. ZSWI3 TaxID=2966359 RepID=UPI00214FA64D|nr:TRAP transporter small permease subunit [Nitratireductor sp. ZSWI3]MCR4265201.1 TRAP transporter small permease subunit [Nitratireductor sp. ZSWI3]
MLRLSATVAGIAEYIAVKVMILAFAIMVISIVGAVVSRNTGISVPWFEELARYMQIWTIGVGFALALRKGLLSGSEILLFLLPRSVAKAAVFVTKVSMLFVSGFLLKVSLPLIGHLYSTYQLSPILGLPIIFVYLGLYTGFALSVLFLVTSLIANLHGRSDQLDLTFAQFDQSPRAD